MESILQITGLGGGIGAIGGRQPAPFWANDSGISLPLYDTASDENIHAGLLDGRSLGLKKLRLVKGSDPVAVSCLCHQPNSLYGETMDPLCTGRLRPEVKALISEDVILKSGDAVTATDGKMTRR